MPRGNYDYLTEATERGLMGNQKAVAIGWDKSQQMLSAILQSEKSDPYAYFQAFYEGVLRGRVSTEAWDSDMAALRARYAGEASIETLTQAMASKAANDAATTCMLIEAARDGRISSDEAALIRIAIGKERKNLDDLDRMLGPDEI